MLLDARALPSDTVLESEVCIVGAGAAGITLAREFAGAPFRVILLEGGGLKFEHRSQFLHRASIGGRAYPPPEVTHRRQVGGTTAVWFGRCRPFDPLDFQVRSWISRSGWPITEKDVEPYLGRAAEVAQLDSADFQFHDPELTAAGLEPKLFRFSPPTHFGQAHLPSILQAGNTRLVLHANAVAVDLEPGGLGVEAVRCRTLSRRQLRVRARLFVLACGGVENAHLLLNSRDVHHTGVGNGHDLVGRFFMEHAYSFIAAAPVIPTDFSQAYLRLNYESFQRNLQPTAAISLPASRLRDERLLNSAAFLIRRPIHKTDDRYLSRRMQGFAALVETIQHRQPPSRRLGQYFGHTLSNAGTVVSIVAKALRARIAGRAEYALHLQSETVPNPESRITLSGDKDALGMNQAQLEWRLTPQDLESFRRSTELILAGLAERGLTIRKFNLDLLPDGSPVSLGPSKHHMGTTRMHPSERQGVVDEQCRVHGIENLYIAGSSVFPTSGMANPTLMLLALTLRLADRIKRTFG